MADGKVRWDIWTGMGKTGRGAQKMTGKGTPGLVAEAKKDEGDLDRDVGQQDVDVVGVEQDSFAALGMTEGKTLKMTEGKTLEVKKGVYDT